MHYEAVEGELQRDLEESVLTLAEPVEDGDRAFLLIASQGLVVDFTIVCIHDWIYGVVQVFTNELQFASKSEFTLLMCL